MFPEALAARQTPASPDAARRCHDRHARVPQARVLRDVEGSRRGNREERSCVLRDTHAAVLMPLLIRYTLALQPNPLSPHLCHRTLSCSVSLTSEELCRFPGGYTTDLYHIRNREFDFVPHRTAVCHTIRSLFCRKMQ